jgi:uncharacterized protein (TIGR02757 family)
MNEHGCSRQILSASQRNFLVSCAETYETAGFYRNTDGTPRDPSFFMHQYTSRPDQECAALIAASLSFGSRTQILNTAGQLFDTAAQSGTSLTEWITAGGWISVFPEDTAGYYYRTFSNRSMHLFFTRLKNLLLQAGSLGSYFEATCGSEGNLISAIVQAFPETSPLIPKNTDSACKRICLFLRWMVRSGPVDLGLWEWYSTARLIIPVDTHVLESARHWGIISCRTGTGSTAAVARQITAAMREIWPDDPCKGDYALFGADEADMLTASDQGSAEPSPH